MEEMDSILADIKHEVLERLFVEMSMNFFKETFALYKQEDSQEFSLCFPDYDEKFLLVHLKDISYVFDVKSEKNLFKIGIVASYKGTDRLICSVFYTPEGIIDDEYFYILS